ncbi:toll/interleukin-1 receptor domain-containing protein [Pedobacter sp. UC225_65]|uniref:toll/interleukin-1 receptor domain-containing protein n=1 Tax=Pedobacter sp. UC225_65 TaxID=3350173 RepID=UPI00366FFEB2
MKYRYQLLILGVKNKLEEQIIDLLHTKVGELGLQTEVVRIIEPEAFEEEYLGNQPTFCIYFATDCKSSQDIEIVSKLIKDGTMVLPIYFNEVETDIPDELRNQNAIKYNENETDRIVDVILEAFELLRSTRKVFISYKRKESRSVAIQLFEALESHGFDTFLDTHSIAKGEKFQEELWHRMTDCDVILLLNTVGFLESRWCKEEFAEASAKQIGLVQLVWPNHNLSDIDLSSHISYPIKLDRLDFIDEKFEDGDHSHLLDEIIEQILQQVESVRARNLAARQDSLITDFRNTAEKYGRVVTVQPEKFLTEDRGDQRIVYIPTVGIPQSTSCQSAELKKEFYGKPKVSIRLIYDDLRIRDKWIEHLDWLNDNFKKDIKTLKKQQFDEWLKGA